MTSNGGISLCECLQFETGPTGTTLATERPGTPK